MPTSDPASVLLSNPPGFILLGLMFALAAYLRQVAENREALLEQIQGDKVWNFPIGEDHTKLKVKRLKRSRIAFGWIARLCILFSIVVAFRLALLAYSRYRFPTDLAHYERFFRGFDFCIIAALFLLVCGLGIIHELGRSSDRKISERFESWLLQYLAEQTVPSSSPTQNCATE